MDRKDISTKKKNYNWLFVCVDVYTRKGYIFPMKDNSSRYIIDSFNKVLLKIKSNTITCDYGSEFTSKIFTKLCNDNIIKIDYGN